LEQMGFAQSDSSIDIQRVVDVAWIGCNGITGCKGKAVSGADDKVLKVVASIQNQRIVVWQKTGFRRKLLRLLLHNLDRNSGWLALDGVDRFLDDIVVPADDPVPCKLAGNPDRQ